MRFEVVIFDFDGTLVDSARAKYQAFFRLFPQTTGHQAVVAEVLEQDPDGSRHQVIPRMMAEMSRRGLSLPAGQDAADRIEEYGRLVLDAVGAAAELPGASTLLRQLRGRCAIYISSQTPEEPVRRLVASRGWAELVDGVFGYPRDKAATVATLLSQHRVQPEQVAVVGDGESDERAAVANRCAFFRVTGPQDLADIGRRLVEDRV